MAAHLRDVPGLCGHCVGDGSSASSSSDQILFLLVPSDFDKGFKIMTASVEAVNSMAMEERLSAGYDSMPLNGVTSEISFARHACATITRSLVLPVMIFMEHSRRGSIDPQAHQFPLRPRDMVVSAEVLINALHNCQLR